MRMSMALSKESGMTQEILNRLLEEIESGMPLRWAASMAGVKPGKLSKWIAQGQEGIEPFDKLYDAVEMARAVPVAEQLRNIQRAAADPARWQAAVWLLERLDPDTFVKHERPDDTPLDVTIVIGGDRSQRQNNAED